MYQLSLCRWIKLNLEHMFCLRKMVTLLVGIQCMSSKKMLQYYSKKTHLFLLLHIKKVVSLTRAKHPHEAELIPVSVAWRDWEYCYSPRDGMLVHRKVTPTSRVHVYHQYPLLHTSTTRTCIDCHSTYLWCLKRVFTIQSQCRISTS